MRKYFTENWKDDIQFFLILFFLIFSILNLFYSHVIPVKELIFPSLQTDVVIFGIYFFWKTCITQR